MIQARTNSKRYPNKIFENIYSKNSKKHKSIIHKVIEECVSVSNADVILAVPECDSDTFGYYLDKIICPELYRTNKNFRDNKNLVLFAGSEENVLNRFYKAIDKQANYKAIIRITADCPLITSKMITSIVQFFENSDVDYVSNTTIEHGLSEAVPDEYTSRTYMFDGVNIEVFSYEALQDAWVQAYSQYDFEHVTPWIKRNRSCKLYNLGHVYLDAKLSLDTKDDLKNIRLINSLFESGLLKFDEHIKHKYHTQETNRKPKRII